MSSFQIVREKKDGFGALGQTALSDEVYIKVSCSFKDALPALHGARLHVFMCVALHETEIIIRQVPALSLSSIQRIIIYSRPTVVDALDHLVEHRFLEELPERDKNGEKQYRVCAYAWFGNAPPSPSGASKKTLPAKKNFLPLGGEGTVPIPSESLPLPTSYAPVRKIFSQAGVYGNDLETCARMVGFERAERWVRWIGWARKFATETYFSPAGVAVHRLSRDPEAEPPDANEMIERDLSVCVPVQAALPIDQTEVAQSTPATAHVTDPIARGIWDTALSELELQMPKAAFNTWVKSTRALSFENDMVVVQVRSVYAKEWLENRLDTTVRSTLAGIVGRSVEVRYDVLSGS